MQRASGGRPPNGLPERTETSRKRIRACLERDILSARELSGRVGLSEKEVVEHLAHLQCSLNSQGGRLIVEPGCCLSCGFAFERRGRLTKPSKCPKCHATRVKAPRFSIE